MWFYLGVLLATITFYFLRFHYDLVRQWYMSLRIPGPIALPLIGNGLLFVGRSPTGTQKLLWLFLGVYNNFKIFDREFWIWRHIIAQISTILESVAGPRAEHHRFRSKWHRGLCPVDSESDRFSHRFWYTFRFNQRNRLSWAVPNISKSRHCMSS